MLLYTRSNLYKIFGLVAFLFVLYLSSLSYTGFLKGRDAAEKGIPKRVRDDTKASVFAALLKPLIFEPKHVTIGKIALKDIKVVQVGVEANGRLEVPKSYDEIGWYKNGPKAGEDGNAILAAHYDRVGGAPAVFYNLGKLQKGDKISIKDETGMITEFVVYEVSYVDINDSSSVTKAYETSKEPILTVITCGGAWNPVTHDYSKRLLIKAKKL